VRLRQRDQDAGEIVVVDTVTAQWVVFAIGERLFAFPGRQVVEILPLVPIHFVPGCPTALEGVIEVRGTIWSVLRLGDLLDTSPGLVTRRAAVLLGVAGSLESGLRVDEVIDVCEVVVESILPPPVDLPGRLSGLVTGIFQHRGRVVLALDLEWLLADWCAARP
jgi:purine-binding chemotaxis protein CheW